jgi:hypothetical protein
MSTPAEAGGKSENRSQPPENFPASHSEFWLLILDLVDGARRRLERALPPGLKAMVEPDGIEPTTSCLQSRRSPN